MAKCYVASSKNETENDGAAMLNLAISQLDKAMGYFRQCEDCLGMRDCYYLYSIILNKLGEERELERDKFAELFAAASGEIEARIRN